MNMSRSWHLDDAKALAERNPYTFYKPSSAAVALLRPGNIVKLIFALAANDAQTPTAERMWVRIDRIEGECFVGSLDNDPDYIADLKHGDVIQFDSRHIIQTNIDDPVPDPTAPYWARCFVSNRVFKDGMRVGYLYRNRPDHEEDSGWRIAAGDESEEYMDDPKNSTYVSLGAVLGKDDSFVKLLETAAPCAFARNVRTGEFEPTHRRHI